MNNSFAAISALLGLIGFAPVGIAQQIPLQQATATFSQSYFGDFSVRNAIGENPGDLLGWAIYDGNANFGTTSPQTAVFETASDISSPIRTSLDFELRFQNWNPQHLLGAFRISVTSDSRTTFADGLPNNGAVDANWTVLMPGWLVSDNGTAFVVQPDGTVITTGITPSTDIYYLRFETTQQGITGIRLEALADSSLPTGGPGRVPAYGNFVLTGLSLRATAVPEPATISLLAISAAMAGLNTLAGWRNRKGNPKI